MYRYQGNTGRYIWVPDTPRQEHARRPPAVTAVPEPSRSNAPVPQQGRGREKTVPPPLDLGSGLSNILSNVFPDGFEMEDALLLLVLFLMYKESGDKELLIIMGAMFLL